VKFFVAGFVIGDGPAKVCNGFRLARFVEFGRQSGKLYSVLPIVFKQKAKNVLFFVFSGFRFMFVIVRLIVHCLASCMKISPVVISHGFPEAGPRPMKPLYHGDREFVSYILYEELAKPSVHRSDCTKKTVLV
jgi:hypothetical protein